MKENSMNVRFLRVRYHPSVGVKSVKRILPELRQFEDSNVWIGIDECQTGVGRRWEVVPRKILRDIRDTCRHNISHYDVRYILLISVRYRLTGLTDVHVCRLTIEK
jgi:hypothetical protein